MKTLYLKKNSIFISLIISYIVIFLIPMLISMIVQKESLKLIENDSINNNFSMLEKSKSILDDRLTETIIIAEQIKDNTKVNRFTQNKIPVLDKNYFEIYQIIQDIKPFQVNSKFITTFNIYFDNSKTIVTPDTSYNSNIYYDYHLNYKDFDYNDWLNQNLSAGNQSKFSMNNVVLQGNNKRMLCYTHPLSTNATIGFITILIDETELKSLLSSFTDIEGDGGAYILDEKGNLITSVGENTDEIIRLDLVFNDSKGFIKKKINDKDMIITHLKSSQYGWFFASILPNNIVMENAQYIRKITSIIVLCSTFMLLMLAFFLAYIYIRPIRHLLDSMRINVDYKKLQVKNEFHMLNKGVANLISSNNNLQIIVDEQKELTKAVFFERILESELFCEQEIENFLSNEEIKNLGKQFVVMNIKIERDDSKLSKIEFKELNTVRLNIKYILESNYSLLHLYISDTDKLTLLMSFEDSNVQENKETVNRFVEKLNDYLKQFYNRNAFISAGSFYSNITEVFNSYVEANYSLSYNYDSDISSIIWYDQIPKSVNSYYYPIEIELRLMNIVRSGNIKETTKIMHNIYNRNFVEKHLTIDKLNLLLHEIKSTAIKLINQINPEDKTIATSIGKININLANTNANDFYNSLTELLYEICNMVCTLSIKRGNKLKDKIIEYIDLSYRSDCICLSSVANEFNITEEYLSRFFKENTGENFSVYIEKLRLNMAKELLETNSKMKIKDISTYIGYTNDHTFRRAFKRLYGVSPNSIKDSAKKIIS